MCTVMPVGSRRVDRLQFSSRLRDVLHDVVLIGPVASRPEGRISYSSAGNRKASSDPNLQGITPEATRNPVKEGQDRRADAT